MGRKCRTSARKFISIRHNRHARRARHPEALTEHRTENTVTQSSAEKTPTRFRLYGVSDAQPGVQTVDAPLTVSWEQASENLSQLPRMFLEPDGSFLWTGTDPDCGPWQLEGTIFDDGRVVRRIELAGNCPRLLWQEFLKCFQADWSTITIELLDPKQIVPGQWLSDHAL